MVSFKSILVPVDFGDSSKEALDVAIELAKRFGSALTLVHTWEIPFYGYGRINLTWNPTLPMPDGIMLPVSAVPLAATYKEGRQ